METLEDLKKEILNCTKCPLHLTKTKYVPGIGNASSGVVFVGEAPGREEDLKGEPFVGSAGKLLTELLFSIGLTRDEVFICNVLKCRPPNNRDPLPEEVNICGNYLIRQLNVLKPDLIVCLGRHSASFIFEMFNLPFTSITKLHGKVFEVEGWDKKVKILPLYHPAAVLYRAQLREEYEKQFKIIGELCKKGKQKTLLDF
ncbi:MAG: type-4 uracil-DNA glycosylase [Archaeoglobaceae archaeon]|nr:type-4 uracil-DNA glycosylase [Archaeoglobaceae archaeon]MDW8117720.1 type-4 uracil-DNA glycosylase [Archaeoglobaceae archaeon]